jgi:3-hydroxyisobutyrate dehydrogenase-like beta-hydroxyacid dehydrogenase
MNVCVMGLGIIGEIWSGHYRADGHTVTVWNRTPKDVPGYVADPSEAIRGAQVVHIVISDPPAVEVLLEKIAPQLKPAMLVLQSTTISPKWSTRFCERVRACGAEYLEAPFTGSKPAAQARANVFYIGGGAVAKERGAALLHTIGKTVFDLGSNEAASGLKLAMNLQIAAMGLALSESLVFARAHGIPDEVYFRVLDQNVAHSGLSDLKKPKLMSGDYAPQFSVKHMRKDVNLAVESFDGGLPVTERVLEVYDRGLADGLGEEDFTSLIRLLGDSGKIPPR